MPRWLQYTLAVLIMLFVVGSPLAYARYRQNRLRNFYVVREGMLLRSGQLSLSALETVFRDYRIKTVVTLRDSHDAGAPPPDIDEELFCKKQGINHVRLPQRGWEEKEDGSVPNDVNVARFLEIMKDPANYPVLIHCLAGKHRTGAMCAIFRMEHDHWTNQQAIDELSRYGYDNVQEHADVLGYLRNYRATWAR
jgi:tyrosine-protein phosphatase SIW14